VEAVLFWGDVEEFKEVAHSAHSVRQLERVTAHALYIYQRYIRPDSPAAVTLSPHAIEQIKEGMARQSNDPTIFDGAQDEVVGHLAPLLEDFENEVAAATAGIAHDTVPPAIERIGDIRMRLGSFTPENLFQLVMNLIDTASTNPALQQIVQHVAGQVMLEECVKFLESVLLFRKEWEGDPSLDTVHSVAHYILEKFVARDSKFSVSLSQACVSELMARKEARNFSEDMFDVARDEVVGVLNQGSFLHLMCEALQADQNTAAASATTTTSSTTTATATAAPTAISTSKDTDKMDGSDPTNPKSLKVLKDRERLLKQFTKEAALIRMIYTQNSEATMASNMSTATATDTSTGDSRHSTPSGRIIVPFGSVDDLPSSVLRSVTAMKVPVEELNANLDVLANILTFTDTKRRQFMSHAMFELHQAGKLVLRANCRPPVLVMSEDDIHTSLSLHQAVQHIKMCKCLGTGSFGQVYKGKRIGRDKKVALPKEFAVKILPHNSQCHRQWNYLEMSFHRMFSGQKYFPELIDLWRVDNELWAIQEFVNGGTLKDIAKTCKIAETDIAYVAQQVLLGLDVLHSAHIAHRDLKSANLMLTSTCTVKIIDMGLCADMSKGPRKQLVGSPWYMAPEIIKNGWSCCKVDIWSLGVCLLELANNTPTHFKSVRRSMWASAVHGLHSVEQPGFKDPSKWSPEFSAFLAQALDLNPTTRPSAKTLLKSEWLRTCSSKKHIEKLVRGMLALKVAL